MKCRTLLLALVVLALIAGCGDDGSGSGGDRAECAAARLEPDLDPDPTLPDAVAETEVAIVRAAGECDRDGLEPLADFELGEARFATLVELFEGPVVLDGETYVWPGVEENGPRTAIAADGTWQYFETGETPAAPPPAELVAIVDDKLLVLASDDGRVLRTLAEAPDVVNAGLTVSSDGRMVYFARAVRDFCGENTSAAEIVSVPIEGGPIQIVASGDRPELSPDGRWLAYASGGANQCGPRNLLVVQELGSAEFRQQLYEEPDADYLELLGWSGDSSSLPYLTQPDRGVFAPKHVEPAAGGEPRPVEPPRDSYLATYLAGADSIAVVQDLASRSRVVEIDGAGEVRRELFAAPQRRIWRVITADSSGSHLLFTTHLDPDEHTEVGRIWRWSEGSGPVEIFTAEPDTRVGDVAWVPAASPM